MPDSDVTTDRPRKRKCLRRVGVVVGFLLAGAIFNVLVAWGCAAFMPGIPSSLGTSFAIEAPEGAWYGAHLSSDAARTRIFVMRSNNNVSTYQGAPPTVPNWSPMAQRLERDRFVALMYQASGWPFQSIYWEWAYQNTGGEIQVTGILLSSVQRPIHIDRQRALPLVPIPLGFAANTVVYAVCCWLVFFALAFTRSKRRARRGLCPDCGYDLRGADHGNCPECGEAVKAK